MLLWLEIFNMPVTIAQRQLHQTIEVQSCIIFLGHSVHARARVCVCVFVCVAHTRDIFYPRYFRQWNTQLKQVPHNKGMDSFWQ
jgi:hypothetical protein